MRGTSFGYTSCSASSVMNTLVKILMCGIAVLSGVSLAGAAPLPTDLILDRGPLGDFCGNTTTGCYGAAATSGSNPNTKDVIGSKTDFDVKSIQFTTWTGDRVVGDILFNFHSGAIPPSDWVIAGFTMKVGDLLFTGGGLKFGVALIDHSGASATVLNAGQLYQVDDFLTSDQFGLNNSQVVWRDAYWCQQFGGSNCTTPAVRMDSTGAVALGSVNSIALSHFDEGLYANGIEIKAHLDFDPGGVNGVFWQTYKNNGGLDVSFASAICANDIVEGHVTPVVPEPSPALLIFGALLGLGAWTQRGRRLMAVRIR